MCVCVCVCVCVRACVCMRVCTHTHTIHSIKGKETVPSESDNVGLQHKLIKTHSLKRIDAHNRN